MRRMRTSGIALLFLAAVGLSACAADGTLQLPAAASTPYPPPGFTHQGGNSHVELYWNCTQPEPGILQVEGLAFNPWSGQPVGFLEFDVVGVGSRGRAVSQVHGAARDFLLYTNQNTPFRLDLRTSGAEIRFDLFYQYRFQDRSHRSLDAGPAVGVPPRLAQQDQHFMVLDACSETQHRMR
jgi:hypothetical protein